MAMQEEGNGESEAKGGKSKKKKRKSSQKREVTEYIQQETITKVRILPISSHYRQMIVTCQKIHYQLDSLLVVMDIYMIVGSRPGRHLLHTVELTPSLC